jgi:hypothetical protein
VFGLLLHLTVSVERRPEIGAFLLSFEREDEARAKLAATSSESRTKYRKSVSI